jgi:DNA-binding transcriptional LysR family regulator
MADAAVWSHYRSLVAAIDEGSLSAAARRLGLTQPTLGRHIEALETALGLALFTRSGAGLTPTRAALALAPHARAMAAAAETLLRTAAGEADEEAGVVRVTASEVIGAEVLPAILAGFRRHHPRIAIELSLSNTAEDLLRRDADIAVRMVRPTQAALLARRIGAVRVGFFARGDYLDRAGMPESLEDLRNHTLIGPDREPILPSALAGVNFPVAPELFSLRTDSDAAQIAALRAGFGIGACQLPIAARESALIPVLPNRFGFDLDIWVVMHEDLRADRRAKALFDALAAGLAAYLGVA